MQKTVEPVETRVMQHPVSIAATSVNNRFLAAYSDVGVVSVLAEIGSEKIVLGRDIAWGSVSVEPEGRSIAFVESPSATAVVRSAISGEETRVLDAPGAQDCYFDDGGRLWILRQDESEDVFVLEVRDAGNLQIITSEKFGDSYFVGGMLINGGSPGRMLINIYSGQSEAENYLANFEGETLTIRHLAAMDGEQIPIAAPHGDEIVTIDRDNYRMRRFLRPFEKSNDSTPWPEYGDNEDEIPGYSGCYLDLVNVLVASQDGRLFVLHSRSMTFTHEIGITGFETGNLIAFNRCGESVYAFYGSPYRTKRPQMVRIPIASILSDDGV